MGLIPHHPNAEYDALIIGRAGMDLYPLPDGTKIEDANSFASDLGGSSGNIAVAMAKHGRKVSLAAPISDDPVGRFVSKKLAQYGVHHATPDPISQGARTSLAMAETLSTGSETVIYRNGAADFEMPTLSDGLVHSARCVVATGTALAQEPSRRETLSALARAHFAILDLDYRPYSWAEGEAAQTYAEAANHVNMIVGNDEEFDIIGGKSVAQDLAHSGKIVLFKRGSEGCEILGGDPKLIPPFMVSALKPFGAGDAFLGGTLSRLMMDDALEDAVRFGAAAAALVVSRRGCASAMPNTKETEAFMKGYA
ncbi:MAG: PfkB family carbohydrate kinase [Pseudomonadota bacterium]